jgi:glycosyltransferase involved in cell wall biosynthesis
MELVSVIVPAYNAAATIDETLTSVRAQTYQDLDVIVVDDGSADDTLALAARHAAQDARIRVVSQPNQGVAAARNHGIRLARGALLAPIDADDLWSPYKIERQVEVFEREGDCVSLVYTLHACIDGDGRITSYGHRPGANLDLRALCHRNVVGNGSSAMMRTADVVALGGYDASLRARKAQGCEDYKLYLALAARGRVVAIPDFLTGYRYTPTNMSSDVLQMERSHQIVFDELVATHPELAADVDVGRRVCSRWLIVRALGLRDWRSSRALFYRLLARDLGGAAGFAASIPVRVLRRIASRLWRRVHRDKQVVAASRRFLTGPAEM